MPAVRLLAVPLVVALLALPAAACGGGGGSADGAPPPKVTLTVHRPGDSTVTRDATVTVSGSVQPVGASVQVAGRPADVVGSGFTASVDLDPGDNVIDLAATAPGRTPALTALRVTREMPIAVPDLSGLTAAEARVALDALGLGFKEERAGGLLEQLLPGEPGVCSQSPGAGTEVTRGTRVTAQLGKRC
jgi:hypothetical protein